MLDVYTVAVPGNASLPAPLIPNMVEEQVYNLLIQVPSDQSPVGISNDRETLAATGGSESNYYLTAGSSSPVLPGIRDQLYAMPNGDSGFITVMVWT